MFSMTNLTIWRKRKDKLSSYGHSELARKLVEVTKRNFLFLLGGSESIWLS